MTRSGPSVRTVSPPPTADPKPKVEPTSGLSPSQIRAESQIEDWQTREINLHQTTALELRSIISDTVKRRCDWTDPIGAEPSAAEIENAWPAKSTTVSIIGADAERLPGTENAPIILKRSPGNAQFLRGLIGLNAGVVAGNASHLRRLYALADGKSPALKQRVIDQREFSDPQLVLGLRAALLGALLGGQFQPEQSEALAINAVLDDGHGWKLNDRANRTPAWLDALALHRDARRDLTTALRRAFGYGQGATGQIRMIDIAHLLPLLRQASATWTWTPPEAVAVPKWAKPAVRGLNRLDALADEQMAFWHRQLRDLRALLPTGTKGRDVVKAVSEAHTAGFSIGEANQDDDLAVTLNRADDIDWAAIDRLEHRVANWLSTAEGPEKRTIALTTVGQDHGRALADATDFLQHSDRWLTNALDAVSSRAGAAFGNVTEEVQGVKSEWAKIRNHHQPA